MSRTTPDLTATELLAAVPDPFLLLDAEHAVAHVNAPAEALLGRPASELVGRALFDAFPGLAGRITEEQVSGAMRDRLSHRFTMHVPRLDTWLSVRTAPVRGGLAVLFSDVKDYKLAERRAGAYAQVQGVLRRVATAVAAETPPDAIYELACREAVRLHDAQVAYVLRYDEDRSYRMLASAGAQDAAAPQPGGVFAIAGGSEVDRLRATGEPVVVPRGATGRFAAAGLESTVLVPVRLAGAVWGALGVAWTRPRRPARAEEDRGRLSDLAELVSLALGNAEARAELARQAATDPLTGLANLRLASSTLDAAVARGRRHDHPLTFAVVDVDHFKTVNDTAGHLIGDRVLCAVGAELLRATREEDLVARIGGDEFAIVLDGTAPEHARSALDRVRSGIADALEARGLPGVTLSIGLCAWEPGLSREGLHRRADDALQWAKLQGRDAVVVHDAERMEVPEDRTDADGERRVRSAQGFWQSALDALDGHIAVLNEAGEVIAVNEAWRRFGRPRVGADYVDLLEARAGGDPVAGEDVRVLRDLLAGRRDRFETEYDLGGRRFRLTANRFSARRPARVIVHHEDVTARHGAQASARFRARLLDEVDAAVVATDPDRRVIEWNRAAERLFGRPAAETLGRLIDEVVPAQDRPAVDDLHRHVADHGEGDSHSVVHRPDGTQVPVYSRLSVLHGPDGRPEARVALSVDVSERLRHERDLEAARDYLGAVTSSMGDGLLVIGADARVHLANAAAARLLGRDAAELAGASVREVLYAGTDGRLAGAPGARRRVDDEFARADGTRLPVSWTASPMAVGEEGEHVVVFHDVTERRLREARLRREAEGLRWAARIRDALDGDLLELFGQPIVELAGGAVTHHELLLRLRDGDGGHVPPGEFLPAAEEHGLMRDLDTWVLRRAVEVAAAGRPVHVNVSAQSVGAPEVLEALAGALAAAAVDPGHIVVEVTETALTQADPASFLRRLRELGCGVALDDFGTGYNGFARVKQLPVDVLKIDQQFVHDLLEDPASAGVIRAVAGLAADLGIAAVAEGIQDAATLARLRELGVAYGQGFYLGVPAPLA